MTHAAQRPWTYADLWEAIASKFPFDVAIRQGSLCYSWQEFNEAANGLARALLTAGLDRFANVGVYLPNRP